MMDFCAAALCDARAVEEAGGGRRLDGRSRRRADCGGHDTEFSRRSRPADARTRRSRSSSERRTPSQVRSGGAGVAATFARSPRGVAAALDACTLREVTVNIEDTVEAEGEARPRLGGEGAARGRPDAGASDRVDLAIETRRSSRSKPSTSAIAEDRCVHRWRCTWGRAAAQRGGGRAVDGGPYAARPLAPRARERRARPRGQPDRSGGGGGGRRRVLLVLGALKCLCDCGTVWIKRNDCGQSSRHTMSFAAHSSPGAWLLGFVAPITWSAGSFIIWRIRTQSPRWESGPSLPPVAARPAQCTAWQNGEQ